MTTTPPLLPPVPDDDAVATYVRAAAPLLGLTIDPAWADAVAANLKAVAGAARLVAEFPLDDDVEPAPVFRA